MLFSRRALITDIGVVHEIRRGGSRSSCFSLRRDLRKFSGDKFISTIRNLESESPPGERGERRRPLSLALFRSLYFAQPPGRRAGSHAHACLRTGGRKGAGCRNEPRRKAERNVYMKRPSANAVTRDSAHRPKERLPSPRFFPKLHSPTCSPSPPCSRFLILSSVLCAALDVPPCMCALSGDSLILSARESRRVLAGKHCKIRSMSKDEQGKQTGSTGYSGS